MRRSHGFWPEMISNAYRDHGGSARNSQVYAWIESNVQLTDHELSPQASANDRPHFVNTVRGIINDMKGRGILAYLEDGLYRLAQ